MREGRRAACARAAAAAFACAFVGGCGGKDLAGAGDASMGTGPANDGGPAPPGACPALGDSGVPPYASEANGTITGPGLDGVLCDGEAYIFISPYTQPPGQILLMLDNLPGQFDFQTPGAAMQGLLSAMIVVSSASPGTYTSDDENTCGTIAFQYSLPPPTNLDCDGGAPPDCPPGCGAACPVSGCDGIPCIPADEMLPYQATTPRDCLGDMQNAQGSWDITLTKVEPWNGSGPSSGDYYTPHGTLKTTLAGDPDAGAATATLTLSF